MEESQSPIVLDLSNSINLLIKDGKEKGFIQEGLISDGYHTFDELYEFRKLYNAALFNAWSLEWSKGISEFAKPLYDVHKSTKHFNGEECFGGGWFIVVAILPTGQITNHYKMKDWDLFEIPVTDKAKYEFDGHTGIDVIERLEALLK